VWQQCTTIKLEITFNKKAANWLLSKVLVSEAWFCLGWARIKLLGHARRFIFPNCITRIPLHPVRQYLPEPKRSSVTSVYDEEYVTANYTFRHKRCSSTMATPSPNAMLNATFMYAMFTKTYQVFQVQQPLQFLSFS